MTTPRPVSRFVAALGLIALAATATPRGPSRLDATMVSRPAVTAAFCAYLAKAITFLEAQRPSPLRDFLLAEARKLDAARCA